MNTSPQTAPGDAIPLSRHNGLPPLADKAQDSMKIIEHDGIFEKTALAVRVSERLRQMSPGALCAAYMIDIDNFRFVNRTLGRAVGDLVLQRTARLLRARFFSAGLAGRLADDVFLAVRFDVASEEDARRTAAELCDALRYTVTEPAPFTTSASIGLHVTAGAESCFENLVRHAGTQLLLAKMRGKNQIALTTPTSGSAECPDARIAEAIRLHIILERSDGWVSLLELGEEPRLLYASRGFFALLGKQQEDIALPCSLHSLGIPSDNLHDHERVLHEGALRGDSVVEHAWKLLAEGKERWIYDRALRLDNFGGQHPVMLIVSNDVSARKQQEQETREAYERLHTLYAETSARLWEVDVDTRSFRLFDDSARADTAKSGEFPLSLLESGMIHADSSALFKVFADGLLQGKEEGRGIFAVRLQPADIYRWMSISYRKVCDDCGRSHKVIGTLIPHTSGSVRSSLLQKSLMQEMLRPSLLAYQRVNLTRNMVDDRWERNQPGVPFVQPVHYSDTVHAQEAHLYDKGDAAPHNARFSREHLLNAFESGQRWVVMEYRRIDDKGAIAWVSHAVCMARDPVSCDIYGFIFVRDVDRRRDWNVAQALKSSRNNVTMLYDLPFGGVLKKTLTASEKDGGILALISIAGIEGTHMEQLKPIVTTSFAVALDDDAVVGRFCKNHLICLFPNIFSCQEARQKLENAFIFTHRALSDTPLAENLRFVAALSDCRALGRNIGGSLCQMRRECDRKGDAVADRVFLMDEIAAFDLADYEGGDITAAGQEHASMSGDDSREAFSCLSAMAGAISPDAALAGLLRRLGCYYQADRAYTLAILENGSSVEALHEWTAAGKISIKRNLTGMPLDRIPLLIASLRRQKSLFQTRGKTFASGAAAEKIWSYRVVPLKGKTLGMTGFLCFENPKCHQDSTSVIDALMPHIVREWEKVLQAPLNIEEVGPRPLQDLNAYQAVIPHIDSRSYGSMGVFSVDVPQITALSKRYSFAYGRRVLRDVAQALVGAFGKKLLFRIWDTEFIALCPNLVRDVFLDRMRRVRDRLQRLYPETLRFGLAWADENFTAAQLVNQARNLMLSQILASDDAPRSFSLGSASYASFGQALLQGAFTSYLQPKINMRDGSLVGAEVLVRGIDERGNIIPPGQFIEQMEKMGYLRDLDLHMLSCTLTHLSQWQRRHLPLPRLSVNFSRFTLLSPTTRASVLALLSRHEEVAPDLVEIELTETASYCGDAVIEQAINSLRELGFRFALDDFGSQYSNLAIFTNIDFDTVKLDRSLTIALTRNPLNRDMTRSIARVCKQRGMDCIAEGVETQEQIAILLQDGWEQAQGYYFDPPLPVAEFERKYLAV